MSRHRFLEFPARSLIPELDAKMGSCPSQPSYPVEMVTQIFGVSITPRIWLPRKGQKILIKTNIFSNSKSLFKKFLKYILTKKVLEFPTFSATNIGSEMQVETTVEEIVKSDSEWNFKKLVQNSLFQISSHSSVSIVQ